MKKKTAEVAQHSVPGYVSDAINDYLSSFDPMTRKPDEVLKGNRLPALFDIYCPAFAKSNRQAVIEAEKAARDHTLQSPRFAAVRGKWSNQLQTVLLIPESKFVEGDPELYEVTWASDGSDMRIDLAEALVPRQWGTPSGYIRRVKVTLHRHLPIYGSALVLHLPEGEVREDPQVDRERQQRKAAREAAQGGAQGGAQTPAATGQSDAGKGGQTGPATQPPNTAPQTKPAPGQQANPSTDSGGPVSTTGSNG